MSIKLGEVYRVITQFCGGFWTFAVGERFEVVEIMSDINIIKAVFPDFYEPTKKFSISMQEITKNCELDRPTSGTPPTWEM